MNAIGSVDLLKPNREAAIGFTEALWQFNPARLPLA